MNKKEKVKKPLYKKWWFWVIVVTLVGAMGSGLSGGDKPAEQPPTAQTKTQAPTSTPEPSETPNTPENSPITVEISVDVGGDAGKPEFTINTNLPDETEFMLTLSGKNNFMAQTKVTVENGHATSEVFSNNGEALSGAFSLDVSMSLPRLQSDAVRSVIGETGENIAGPFVETDEITGDNWVFTTFEYDF